MHTDRNPGRVFRDPIHDIIFIPRTAGAVLDLLETPAVQRLRRVRQLGLAHLVFPGAEHSRFIHSLGVQHLADRMLERIRTRGGGDPAVEATLARASEIRAAALLHDIGHGPFSHTFENVLADTVGRHESWSRRILLDPAGEVREVLDRHGLDVDFVAELIEGRAADLLAQDIVSSQLDADRLDYLLRDSHMTGVAYGKIDLAWILNVMRPGRSEDGRVRLGVDAEKGLHAVESYLFARRSIHLQVYHHRSVRAFEAMLANLIALGRRLLAEGAPLPAGTPATVIRLLSPQPLDTETYLALDDSDIHMMLKAWAECGGGDSLTREAARLAGALIRRKNLYDHIDLRGRPEAAAAVAAGIARMRADGEEAVFRVHFDDWESTLYLSERAGLDAGRAREDAFARVIPVVDAAGAVRALERDAPWLDMMQRFPGRQTRLYFDPGCRHRLRDLLALAEAR